MKTFLKVAVAIGILLGLFKLAQKIFGCSFKNRDLYIPKVPRDFYIPRRRL